MIKAYVYPAFNARYYSLYVEGLRRLLGPSYVRFTTRGFPAFGHDCLAIRIRQESEPAEHKIYVHSNDHPDLDEQGLEWCDLFGKVNLDPEAVPEEHAEKVLALGPTFAVRVWGPFAAEIRGVLNHLASPSSTPGLREHVRNYRGQYASRFSEESYFPTPSRSDYVFFNAALWEREPDANALRARFIDACRAVASIRFEGGLSPRESARGDANFRGVGFESYLCPRYSVREYLEKTRVSTVALNNPAYLDCHSWRLAEYLALGKAIISTPIVRALPAPLEHGVHVHYVDGSLPSLHAALEEIADDDAYRRNLERNARAYYERHLAPTSVVSRMLGPVISRRISADQLHRSTITSVGPRKSPTMKSP